MDNVFNLPASDEFDYSSYKIPKVNNNILVLSDIHIPYHNIPALTCAIKYGKEHDVNTILLNGDIIDCYMLSKFQKDPRKRSIKYELDCTRQFLDILDKEFPKAKKIYKTGNHCFDDKTEILTSSGWKSGIDIGYKDNLATYNIDTESIEYQYPTDIIKKEYDGLMYSYNENNFDFNITKGHRLLYNTNVKTSKLRFDEVRNINFSNSRRIWMKHTVDNKNNEYPITDDKLELLAWIYTDGCIIGNKGINQSPQYKIYQSKEDNISRIEKLLERLEMKYSKNKRDKIIKEICGKKLKSQKINYEFNLLRGRASKIKDHNPLFLDDIINERYVLPSFITKLSKRQFDHFIKIILLADGSRHRKTNSFCIYGNKVFIDQLQTLCMLNGYRSSIYTYRETQYRLNITPNVYKSCMDKSGSKVKTHNYKGLVWCATVPNSTLVVRRNGKILFTGNCKRWENYMKNKAPELFDCEEFTLDFHLKLDERKIDYVKDERIVYAGKLPIIHGHEFGNRSSGTVNPARTALLKAKKCVMVSHSHITSEDCKNSIDGDMITAWSTGALCELHPEYSRINDWNHGFAHVITDNSGNFYVNNKRIINGKLM